MMMMNDFQCDQMVYMVFIHNQIKSKVRVLTFEHGTFNLI